jgi:hypothetical protein
VQKQGEPAAVIRNKQIQREFEVETMRTKSQRQKQHMMILSNKTCITSSNMKLASDADAEPLPLRCAWGQTAKLGRGKGTPSSAMEVRLFFNKR